MLAVLGSIRLGIDGDVVDVDVDHSGASCVVNQHSRNGGTSSAF